MELTLTGFSRAEVLQYLGWRGSEITPDVEQQLQEGMAQTLHTAQPRYTYRVFDLLRQAEGLYLKGTGVRLPGDDLAALLRDCQTCVLLAATLGAPVEGLMRRAAVRNRTAMVILDCCGSAAIEAVCDQAEAHILARHGQGLYPTDRFSPGYGDLPLDFQHTALALLDAPRQIGLGLTDSCILTPRKSVTAILGLAVRPQTKRFRGCAHCSMFETCSYRKAGKTCGR